MPSGQDGKINGPDGGVELLYYFKVQSLPELKEYCELFSAVTVPLVSVWLFDCVTICFTFHFTGSFVIFDTDRLFQVQSHAFSQHLSTVQQ